MILSDFIGHRSFIQGNLQSEEDYYPYLGRRKRRRIYQRRLTMYHTRYVLSLGTLFRVLDFIPFMGKPPMYG